MNNKTPFIIITIALIVGIGIIVIAGLGSKSKTTDKISEESVQNVEVRDGVQYITIGAGGGYSPRVSVAQAGIPTKLIVKTNGTYDCSSSLVINAINYREMLPQTGETEIDLGIPEANTPLQGMCSMGMYSFLINFNESL